MQKRILAIVVALAVAVPALAFGGGRMGPPSKLVIKQTAGEVTIEQTLTTYNKG